jgi:hypothetical protein
MGHEGKEGEQRHSSTLPLTSALDGGGWLTPHLDRFTPGSTKGISLKLLNIGYPILDMFGSLWNAN